MWEKAPEPRWEGSRAAQSAPVAMEHGPHVEAAKMTPPGPEAARRSPPPRPCSSPCKIGASAGSGGAGEGGAGERWPSHTAPSHSPARGSRDIQVLEL
jgi:hypothetical protein